MATIYRIPMPQQPDAQQLKWLLEEMTRERDEARRWARAWKEAAKTERFYRNTAERFERKYKAELDAFRND